MAKSLRDFHRLHNYMSHTTPPFFFSHQSMDKLAEYLRLVFPKKFRDKSAKSSPQTLQEPDPFFFSQEIMDDSAKSPPFFFSQEIMDNSAKSSPQPLKEPDPESWHDFSYMMSSVLYDEPAIQSETNESKLKRNLPSATDNTIRKKRLSDDKYRQKRKEEIIETKEEPDCLRKELSRLAEENETLKMEVLDKTKTLQCLEEINRLLMQSSHQVKTENCSAGDVDLLRENAELKNQIDDLLKSMNNPSKLEILKLEREKAESEREMRVLKVIVEALCEKINQTHQGQQNLLW